MKVAVIYNRKSQKPIELLGMPKRAKYCIQEANRRVAHALKGHMDLIDRLDEFMARTFKGEQAVAAGPRHEAPCGLF